MSRTQGFWIMLAGLASVWGAGCASTQEASSSREVALQDTPTAVRATIERLVGNEQILEIEREIDDGKLFYEVEFKKDGLEQSVEISEDGTVLEEERELTELPVILTASIASKYSDVLVESVRAVVEPGKETLYEVTVANAKLRRELTLNAQGDILKDKPAGESAKEKD